MLCDISPGCTCALSSGCLATKRWICLLHMLRRSYRPEARGYVIDFPLALPEGIT